MQAIPRGGVYKAMRTLPVAVLLVAGGAAASADLAPLEPKELDETLIAGPFTSPAAYCAHRAKARGGGVCEVAPDHGFDPAAMPADQPGRLRAVRVVTVDQTWHVVIETNKGWFGRSLAAEGNGDAVTFDQVRWRDVVGDREPELMFEHSIDHDPCACADLSFVSTFTTVCRATDDGVVQCSEPVRTAQRDHGAEIIEWTATWRIARDGRVSPTIRDVSGLDKRDVRALRTPFRLRFR